MCPAILDSIADAPVRRRAVTKPQAKKLPSILIVDDDPLSCKILARILDRGEYFVMAVGSGREAFDVLQTCPFDILILDLYMPEQDGIEILGLVRSRFPDLKVLVVSSGLTEWMLAMVRMLGATATLAKSMAVDSLLPAVKDLLLLSPTRQHD